MMTKIYFASVLFILHTLNLTALQIISRQQWGARPATQTTPMASIPAPYAIIHHSDTPSCLTESICKARVKSFQNYHMDHKKWDDIGYNFVIGEDGNIYEGRGWGIKGAHAGAIYNPKSIGVCITGNFSNHIPNDKALTALQALLSYAVDSNQLTNDYKLLAHRQVRSTDCPGQKLFELLKIWDHWSPQN